MYRRAVLILAALALLPAAAEACSIPVFRYALERWDLAPYHAVVFYGGQVSKEVRPVFSRWQEPRANLTVSYVDLDGKLTPEQQKLWDAQGKERPLPWIVLRAPDLTSVWSGSFDSATLASLVDSPMRRDVVAALSKSEIVFLLLLSGDEKADSAARTLLEKEAAFLAAKVKLPKQRDDGPQLKLALPLKAAFTVLSLTKDAAAEAGFLNVIAASEPGLAKVKGPILLPIFGRGRLLGSLHGDDLTAEQIYEVVHFLCGECSCEVKDLNPGADLLVAADWPTIFEKIGIVSDGGAEPKQEKKKTAAALAKSIGTVSKETKSDVAVSANRGELVARVRRDLVPETSVQITPPQTQTAGDFRSWVWPGIYLAGALMLLSGGWFVIHIVRERNAR